MKLDRTKPIPVEGPEHSRLIFSLRQFFDLQLKTIASNLCSFLPTLSGRVLDIGAGQSPWRVFLNSSVSYQGVDVRTADQFGMKGHSDIIYYDGITLPFSDDLFDSAICIEVLEHASEPQKLLSEAFRVLKPGAAFVLTVPWSARVHHVPFDFHRFTRYQLDRMLCDAGFVDVHIKERGNDICAVVNKLIVIAWRLLLPSRGFFLAWTLPLAVLVLFFTAPLLLCAHLSLLFGWGATEDPLGYFITCTKAHDQGLG